jgi:hypothetical protein
MASMFRLMESGCFHKARRDINDLFARGVLRKTDMGGRSTGDALKIDRKLDT